MTAGNIVQICSESLEQSKRKNRAYKNFIHWCGAETVWCWKPIIVL